MPHISELLLKWKAAYQVWGIFLEKCILYDCFRNTDLSEHSPNCIKWKRISKMRNSERKTYCLIQIFIICASPIICFHQRHACYHRPLKKNLAFLNYMAFLNYIPSTVATSLFIYLHSVSNSTDALNIWLFEG
jgi:hypothetical protein